MAKFFEGVYDSKEFLIVDIVVLFSVEKGLRVKHNRVPAVEEVGLFQDSSNSEVTGIGN